MKRYSMKADNIKNIISDIDHLPYRAILFDGTWGIGKSYAVNEALEANPNVCKISMFGLKDTRQIYHEALFQLALKNNIGGKIGEIANNILDGASKIWDKVGQAKEAVQSIVNEREMFLLLSKEFTSVHIIVIDDLERMSDDINLEDIFGIIEELKQCNYVKVIVIANTDEIQSDKKVVFEKYNEKVIERIYHITERAEKVTWSKMNIHADFVEKFLEIHKVKNLRTLEKAQRFFEDVKLFCNSDMSEQFKEELRLICFAVVVESIENLYYLGVPGSGKSFNAKMQIVFLALATQDDILICDPEREYASLVEAMGGEVVRIAAGSRDHINAMDMVDGYGDGGDPVIEKSQFILSLFEQLDKKGINAKERSIIDRCVGEVYEEYQHGGAVPTLRVLREKFLEQEEPEAQDLALVSELFTNGSLDAFAHESNVDVNNRIMVYDILDLGKQLKTMGLLVITDAMLNRVTENWKQGKRTHIFLDEFHVVFENEYSGAFFNSAWRRFRKRNAFPTAITQNVEYLLDSVLASTMISNSEYIVMLNQAEPDRAKLATLLNISTEQMGYITNADAGCGLVKYGSSLVPFVNRFPTNTRLYKLMTTKPGEDSINRGRM